MKNEKSIIRFSSPVLSLGSVMWGISNMRNKEWYRIVLFYYSSKNPISVIPRPVSCTSVQGTNVGTTTRK